MDGWERAAARGKRTAEIDGGYAVETKVLAKERALLAAYCRSEGHGRQEEGERVSLACDNAVRKGAC